MAKQGKSIAELAQELERQANSKHDYVAPVERLTFSEGTVGGGSIPESRSLVVSGLNGNTLALNNTAHGQLAEYAGIPKAYYDRTLREHPNLLAANVNTWVGDKKGDKRLVRTLDGNVRAWLSDRYRPLDNFDLAQAVLPKLIEHEVQVISSEVTENRLYIKGILPALSDSFDAGLGQGHSALRKTVVVSAITISNSEVGLGALKVEPSVFTTWCTNLAVIAAAAMRKYHVGRGLEIDEDFSIFTDKTRQLDDAAFWAKVVDTVGAAFNEETFRKAVESLRGAAETPIVSQDIVKVVEVTTKRFTLPESLRSPIVTALAQGGDFSKWGLAQAVTNVANNAPDYELATELEHVGGKIIDLGPADWKVIAEAA